MSSLTSDELNYLIFRYLQESGYEAGISKSNIDGNIVPPGALVKFVQKGLHYMEMEANLTNGEVEIDEDFSFFQPLDLISKDVKELQEMLRERKRKERDKEKDRERSKESDKEVDREHDGDGNRVKEKDRHEREREREKMEREKEREIEKIEKEKAHEKQLGDGDRDMAIDQSEKENARDEEHGPSSEPMDITMTPTSLPFHIYS